MSRVTSGFTPDVLALSARGSVESILDCLDARTASNCPKVLVMGGSDVAVAIFTFDVLVSMAVDVAGGHPVYCVTESSDNSNLRHYLGSSPGAASQAIDKCLFDAR